LLRSFRAGTYAEVTLHIPILEPRGKSGFGPAISHDETVESRQVTFPPSSDGRLVAVVARRGLRWEKRCSSSLGTVRALFCLTFNDRAPAFGAGPTLLLLLLILLGLAVPVVFRRTYPVQAFTVAAVAGALQVLFITRPLGTDLALLILLYTLVPARGPPWPRDSHAV
jgi:hypothetical protein